MRLFALAALAGIVIGGCHDSPADKPPPLPSVSPAPDALKPEMLVHWDGEGQVACGTPELMVEFIEHAKAEETTKGLAMLKAHGPCSFIPHGGTAKIVSIGGGYRYPLIEIVPAGSGASDGLWTPAQGTIPGIAPP